MKNKKFKNEELDKQLIKEEGTFIPECWAMKFFGYTLFEIKQFIDFGKSKNFEPEKTVFDRDLIII